MENPTCITYTYYSSEIGPVVIEAGKNGVTQEWILYLQDEDDQFQKSDWAQEKLVQKLARMIFNNRTGHSVSEYSRLSTNPNYHLDSFKMRIYEIADDILEPQQKKLLDDMEQPDAKAADIARRDGVSRAAIFHRLKKIYDRITAEYLRRYGNEQN